MRALPGGGNCARVALWVECADAAPMVPVIVPHDPAWKAAALAEVSAIHAALGDVPLTLHHIGSTAIPGCHAKPILDLLGEVADPGVVRRGALEGLGYEALGAYGIPGRLYFRKSVGAGRRSHHLHVFQTGSPHAERHLAFRDYLIAHPEVVAAYSALKLRLVRVQGATHASYMDGKDAFVRTTERAALAWSRAQAGL